MTARKCGSCRECCIVIGVEPLNKPVDVACEHLCAAGCGIYERRPNACEVFTCGWLEGCLTKSMQPNHTHMVMWGSKMLGHAGQECLVLQCNIRAGHKRHKRTMKWLLGASCKIPVLIIQADRCWLYYRGQEVCAWHQDDFVHIDTKGGGIQAHVVPKAEILKTEEDEKAWNRRQVDSLEINETEPEYVSAMQAAREDSR